MVGEADHPAPPRQPVWGTPIEVSSSPFLPGCWRGECLGTSHLGLCFQGNSFLFEVNPVIMRVIDLQGVYSHRRESKVRKYPPKKWPVPSGTRTHGPATHRMVLTTPQSRLHPPTLPDPYSTLTRLLPDPYPTLTISLPDPYPSLTRPSFTTMPYDL